MIEFHNAAPGSRWPRPILMILRFNLINGAILRLNGTDNVLLWLLRISIRFTFLECPFSVRKCDASSQFPL